MTKFRIALLVALVTLVVGTLGIALWWRAASLPEQHAWETRLSLVVLKLQGRIAHVG